MTDLSALLQPDKGQPATSLHLVDKNNVEAWLKDQPERVRELLAELIGKPVDETVTVFPPFHADFG